MGCFPPIIFKSQIIQDANLSDRQVIQVLCKLRRHWRGGVPSYVSQALRDKKRQLNHLYTKVAIMQIIHFSLQTDLLNAGDPGWQQCHVLHR